MDESGSPVLQGFCVACKSDIDLSLLEPLDTFVCRRCLTIQDLGRNQMRPGFIDPRPKRVFAAMIVLQMALASFAQWRYFRATSAFGAFPIVALGMLAASWVFFRRVKSPPLNAGFGLISLCIALSFMVMKGFPARAPGALQEWTFMVFALAVLFCLGMVFLVGEILRISRTTRA